MLSLLRPSSALFVSVRESEPERHLKPSAEASQNIKLIDAPGCASMGKIRILGFLFSSISGWLITPWIFLFGSSQLLFFLFYTPCLHNFSSYFPQSNTMKILECLFSFSFIQKVSKFCGFFICIVPPLSLPMFLIKQNIPSAHYLLY